MIPPTVVHRDQEINDLNELTRRPGPALVLLMTFGEVVADFERLPDRPIRRRKDLRRSISQVRS